MDVIGNFLAASPFVRCLIFDGHGSHQFVRRALHGDFSGSKDQITAADLKNLSCWKDITYVALPEHALPRLPIQICKLQGDVIWGLPGPCAPDGSKYQ